MDCIRYKSSSISSVRNNMQLLLSSDPYTTNENCFISPLTPTLVYFQDIWHLKQTSLMFWTTEPPFIHFRYRLSAAYEGESILKVKYVISEKHLISEFTLPLLLHLFIMAKMKITNKQQGICIDVTFLAEHASRQDWI